MALEVALAPPCSEGVAAGALGEALWEGEGARPVGEAVPQCVATREAEDCREGSGEVEGGEVGLRVSEAAADALVVLLGRGLPEEEGEEV